MAFPFTHLVISWSAGKLYERVKKTTLPFAVWLLFFFGTLFPDVDHLVDWTFGTSIHRTFTHSILFAIASSALIFLAFRRLAAKTERFGHLPPLACAIAFGVGVLSHMLVDMYATGGVRIFWPLNLDFYWFGVKQTVHESFFDPMHLQKKTLVNALLDMAIGVLWAGYLFVKNKVKF